MDKATQKRFVPDCLFSFDRDPGPYRVQLGDFGGCFGHGVSLFAFGLPYQIVRNRKNAKP